MITMALTATESDVATMKTKLFNNVNTNVPAKETKVTSRNMFAFIVMETGKSRHEGSMEQMLR